MSSFAAGPLWKDYLFAGIRRAVRAVPVVGAAVEVIEDVHKRREAVMQRAEDVAGQSRFERSMVELVRKEFTTSIEQLRQPNLSPPALEAEIRSLYDIRRQGYDAHLFEGLVSNSTFFEQLKRNPNLYGDILNDRDPLRDDKFYMFLDADKTRLLQIPPFALQQLLANQAKGVPEGAVCRRGRRVRRDGGGPPRC